MTQSTDLRIHLKQQPNAAAKLYSSPDELQSRLQAALSDWLIDDLDALNVVTCEPLTNDQIELIWHIEDVQEVRSDLTDDQARDVLKSLRRQHDANIGINWEVIEITAQTLFGDPPDE